MLANSVVPDEMPHFVAFHLGLHCLKKHLWVSSINLLSAEMLSDVICSMFFVVFFCFFCLIFSCMQSAWTYVAVRIGSTLFSS